MSDTQVAGDSKYLFKRDKTWWVKLSVPRPLRPVLGYDLRRSLHTHDIEVARETRWSAIEEFRHKIEKISTIQQGGAAASPAASSKDASDDTTPTKPNGAEKGPAPDSTDFLSLSVNPGIRLQVITLNSNQF